MARGMSLRELERRSGISHSALGRYENGQCSPRLDDVYAIAAALDVTIWDLLPDVNPFL